MPGPASRIGPSCRPSCANQSWPPPGPGRLLAGAGSPLAGTGHRRHVQSGSECETASGFPAAPRRKADGCGCLCAATAPGTRARATTPAAPGSDKRNPPTVHGWCCCIQQFLQCVLLAFKYPTTPETMKRSSAPSDSSVIRPLSSVQPPTGDGQRGCKRARSGRPHPGC